MIKRIVKLEFKKQHVAQFKQIFEDSKLKIRSFPGCLALELLQGKNDETIFFTYSFWENEKALNKYRHSELFQDTWAKTKILFDAKPEAWSTQSLDSQPMI